jgi:glycosyltransferase involved in cell wall biosynthesis
MRVTMLVRNPFTHDSRVEKEARTLVAAGHVVTVVADGRPGLPDSEERDGYRVIRVNRSMSGIPVARYFVHQRRLRRVLLDTSPEILHAHDSDTLPPVATAAAKRRIPFVYDAHELWLGLARRERSLAYWWAFRAWYWIVERRYVRRAAAVIAVSPPIARHLERVYRLAQVELVPNYPPAGPDVEPRDLRSLPAGDKISINAPIVLYLGALMADRGIEQLVRAMPDVPSAHLVLLGNGSLEPALRTLAAELGISHRVHLLAPVPSGDVVAYAASATLGVSPIIASSLSYRYSLPNKLFQYMAAALPVIASDFEQVREVVAGSGAGLVVDATDPSAIAGAIRYLVDHPDEAQAMGARGRRAIRERYNWGVSAAVLVAVYRRISAADGGRAG